MSSDVIETNDKPIALNSMKRDSLLRECRREKTAENQVRKTSFPVTKSGGTLTARDDFLHSLKFGL